MKNMFLRSFGVVLLAGAAWCGQGAVTVFPPEGDWTQLRLERHGHFVRFLDGRGCEALRAISEPHGASLDGVAFGLEREALVVDAVGAMKTGGVSKVVFTSPALDLAAFRGRDCVLEATAQADRRGARASFFFEGLGRGGVGHFHEARRALLAAVPREHRLVSTIPEDLSSLHVRFDLNEPAGARVRFRSFRWMPADEMPERRQTVERKAELLFRADFDGSADATFAKGLASAMVTNGLSFAPGKRGRALRVTRGAKSLLTYAAKGNIVPECGTVAMWVRREWPDEGFAKTGASVYRMLFSTPVPSPRFGSGALFTWFHGPVFRGDQSDLDDGYVEAQASGAGWTHLAMSWDEEGVRLAVNGRYPAIGGTSDSDSELKHVLDHPDGLSFDRVPFDRFFVGSRDGQHRFDGLIDDFRIYSAPLTDKQLAGLYGELATAEDGKPDRPDYAKIFAEKGANPHVGGDRLNLEPVETVRLDSPEAVASLRRAGRFNSVGETIFGQLSGPGYMECSGREGSRFALRFDLDPAHQPLYCVEIDYPDDKLRTMDFIMQAAKDNLDDYALQVGVAAGGEWPSSRRIQTHRCLFWPRAKTVALVGMTARKGAPVAVSEVRVYRVKDSRLPALQVREPKANADGWHRSFALYFEDPAVVLDFAVPAQGSTPETLSTLVDRVVADMKYTGENVFAYPGVWYRGRIGDDYMPRRHAPDFLSGWYEKFDREGLFLMPTLNPNNMPVRRGLITHTAMKDGSLHDSPVSIHDTGRPNGGGWHGTPPNFNIAHPETQAWLEEQVDALLAQGVAHPSFKGLCLHATRHGMLTFGGIEAGYNDYCIDRFVESSRGLKGLEGLAAVDRKNPLRGREYARIIREDPQLLAKWLDWRCDTVAAFWGRIARKLRAARPDLKLWLNAFSLSRVAHAGYLRDDWAATVNREMGLDPAKLRAAADNLVVAQSIVPADFRWRREEDFPVARREEARAKQRDLYRLEGTWSLLKDGLYPWAGQHDRYWESAIGATGSNGGDWKNFKNKNASNSLDSPWMTECTWRVTTINPSGRHALAHFAAPLAFGDVLGMSKGGFLIGTYGMEGELREFMAAFRALPAVVMRDVAPPRDGVVLRQADFDGRSYFYVCNTTGEPRRVSLALPPGTDALSSGSADVVVCGGVRLLKPYELASFAAPAGKPAWK